MNKFTLSTLDLEPVKEFIAAQMKEYGCTRKEAKIQYNRLKADEIWVNDQYQVNIDYDTQHGFGEKIELTHLSIKRLDKEPIHDWRDLQEIKNLLTDPEREALEIYPAESRLLDTANQFHLWVLPVGATIPCGFWARAVTGKSPSGGGKQRPFKKGES